MVLEIISKLKRENRIMVAVIAFLLLLLAWIEVVVLHDRNALHNARNRVFEE